MSRIAMGEAFSVVVALGADLGQLQIDVGHVGRIAESRGTGHGSRN